jgi:hypothetical protein
VGLNVASGAAGNVDVALYSDSSNLPNLLLASSSSVSLANGWNDVSLSIPYYVTSGTHYWLSFGANSGGWSIYHGSSGLEYYQSYTFGSFPTAASGLTSYAHIENTRATYVQIEGYAKCTKVTGAAGTADSVSFYAHNAGNFRLAIYSDSSGPSSKLWESGSTAVSGAPSWQTVGISAGTPTSLTTSAVTYWLCWQVDTANSLPSYTSGSANTGSYISQAYGSFPSTWTGGTLTSEDWSEYVIYH